MAKLETEGQLSALRTICALIIDEIAPDGDTLLERSGVLSL